MMIPIMLAADLTFSSPTQADRIWHIFPQSPAEENEQPINKGSNLGQRKTCSPLASACINIWRVNRLLQKVEFNDKRSNEYSSTKAD